MYHIQITLEESIINTVETYKDITSKLDSLHAINASSSPLAASFYAMLDTHINLVESLFNLNGLLSWFIYENECGAFGLVQEVHKIHEDGDSNVERYTINNPTDFVEMVQCSFGYSGVVELDETIFEPTDLDEDEDF